MASFSFYGSSQTSYVQTLVNSAKLPDDHEKSLQIPDELKSELPKELLQKIDGIITCERIPLDGRVLFLERLVTDYTNNPDRFFGQMGVLSYIQATALDRLFHKHIMEGYKFYSTCPNGSCGYEALIMPFKDNGWTVKGLRGAIAAFIRKNLDALKERDEAQGGFADVAEVKTDGVIDDEKLEKYIEKIETQKAISDGWLSVREIRIFVHCMHQKGINVVVNLHSQFHYNDELGTYAPDVYDTNLRGEAYAGDKEPVYINLIWDSRGHYDYLDPKLAAAVDDDDDSEKEQDVSKSSLSQDQHQDDMVAVADDDGSVNDMSDG